MSVLFNNFNLDDFKDLGDLKGKADFLRDFIFDGDLEDEEQKDVVDDVDDFTATVRNNTGQSVQNSKENLGLILTKKLEGLNKFSREFQTINVGKKSAELFPDEEDADEADDGENFVSMVQSGIASRIAFQNRYNTRLN